MATPKPIHTSWYVVSDLLAAMLAWCFLYVFRRMLLEQPLMINNQPLLNDRFWLGMIMLPLGWLLLFALAGSYKSLYRKSRLSEFTATFFCTLIGCVVIFFLIVINDPQTRYTYYYKAFFAFLLAQFLFTWIGRWTILMLIRKQIRNGDIRFNVLLVGDSSVAHRIYEETKDPFRLAGYYFKGFLSKEGRAPIGSWLPSLGSYDDLSNVVVNSSVNLVVIALEKNQNSQVEKFLEELSDKDVEIKIVPDTMDILSGSVKVSNVYGVALKDIRTSLMPDWQLNIKQVLDIVISIFGLILLSPVFVYAAIRVRTSSPGPIIYRQERVGYKGRKFQILKFRSMIENAERNGPQLSSSDDNRITPWGKVMRKWRLDELPQLWNVLKGDMTLVGPRPEREFFINQIRAQYPYFRYLLKVKPGITSMGMVKFGYAENIDQINQRMRYDLIYIENISLALDLKIMLYTFRIIFLGKGR